MIQDWVLFNVQFLAERRNTDPLAIGKPQPKGVLTAYVWAKNAKDAVQRFEEHGAPQAYAEFVVLELVAVAPTEILRTAVIEPMDEDESAANSTDADPLPIWGPLRSRKDRKVQ